MPGGALEVEIDEDFSVTQTGPAVKVADGVLSAEALTYGLPWPLPR
jgi:hypothetical protein